MRSVLVLVLFVLAQLAAATRAFASIGMVELPASSDFGPLTIFYPASAEPSVERRGPFKLSVAIDAPLNPGNRRLIVVSHGSPASPWVYSDLASTLVSAGFVVALPEHFADNYKDDSEPGPPSWKRRPVEVSRAIDRIRAEGRFSSQLDLEHVGMYGMSAGGHTALTLAGGRWSPSRLRTHCQEHILEDFHACAGLSVSLSGGLLDRVKVLIVQSVNSRRLDDPTWFEHTDPRITAIVSGVPFAADFDPESLRTPKVSLAIISVRGDQWLSPKFHSDAILQACRSCEQLANLQTGGHGALLSPLPPDLSGTAAALVADPPGFDREAVVPTINKLIAAFFVRHLVSPSR